MKVFIDGRSGTTGLRIVERLAGREGIELLTLPEEMRHDESARAKCINESDVSFLCLPDEEARKSASFLQNNHTILIDTSTAHRVNPQWAYGFPELSKAHRQRIANSRRIASPGCHASGFIALVYPLVEKGILPREALLSCLSITGYSGGGKKMIAQYEDAARDSLLSTPRQYGITQRHKHLPEMTIISGVMNEPVFSPIVADFYSGMEVTVPLHSRQLSGGFTMEDIRKVYADTYSGPIVSYAENADEGGFLAAGKRSLTDAMEITVSGNEDRFILTARYDNLGKGASGAAIQCMNIACGFPETAGLEL